MAILCAAQKPAVNGRLAVSISPADCYGLLAEHDLER
jgi:hypothetical protein